MLLRLLTPLRSSAAKLARDKRGSAAVEFAVIVPLMLTMFFGMIELTSAVAVDRKVSMTAQTLSDLASRYNAVGDTDISNFWQISNAMMTPYSSSLLKATITQVYIDPATGVARAQWSKGYAAVTAGATVPVPPNLIARDAADKIIADQYFIVTDTSYNYTPLGIGYVMKADVNLTAKSYMRPRLSTCVFYSPAKACTKT